jgi:pyruvate dehydrogenase (quinone)
VIALVGDPKFTGSQAIPDVPYGQWAEMLGLRGIRVENPEHVGPAWDEALAADRPVVLDVVTDPEVPPLPPHITLDQAKAFASALLKGDPGARRIIGQSLRQKLPGAMPGR